VLSKRKDEGQQLGITNRKEAVKTITAAIRMSAQQTGKGDSGR
jgi:hypothetical protein